MKLFNCVYIIFNNGWKLVGSTTRVCVCVYKHKPKPVPFTGKKTTTFTLFSLNRHTLKGASPPLTVILH